ncbi:hypothetical protein FRB90_001287 [Tulasnella sp. 427]|nr:hypothetical protein FRB90_001287 [Tulasnella sp. 427]
MCSSSSRISSWRWGPLWASASWRIYDYVISRKQPVLTLLEALTYEALQVQAGTLGVNPNQTHGILLIRVWEVMSDGLHTENDGAAEVDGDEGDNDNDNDEDDEDDDDDGSNTVVGGAAEAEVKEFDLEMGATEDTASDADTVTEGLETLD